MTEQELAKQLREKLKRSPYEPTINEVVRILNSLDKDARMRVLDLIEQYKNESDNQAFEDAIKDVRTKTQNGGK